MREKRSYEKPELRRVRIEVETSVLASCHTSSATQPLGSPLPGVGCRINLCADLP